MKAAWLEFLLGLTSEIKWNLYFMTYRERCLRNGRFHLLTPPAVLSLYKLSGQNKNGILLPYLDWSCTVFTFRGQRLLFLFYLILFLCLFSSKFCKSELMKYKKIFHFKISRKKPQKILHFGNKILFDWTSKLEKTRLFNRLVIGTIQNNAPPKYAWVIL